MYYLFVLLEVLDSNILPLTPLLLFCLPLLPPLPISPKVRTIAQKIYGAADIAVEGPARAKFKKYEKMGFGHYPVCMAKTQYVDE